MQTFLPYESFVQSAKVLDYRRLGKQRVEGYQLLQALTGKKQGWRSHPAAKMWAGYESALFLYTLIMCEEWRSRGFVDNMRARLASEFSQFHNLATLECPNWLGRDDLHRSHRSNLIRKDPAHYGTWFSEDPPDLPYVWPSSERVAV